MHPQKKKRAKKHTKPMINGLPFNEESLYRDVRPAYE